MIEPIKLLRPLALYYALSRIDTHETSPNWGPEVEKILASADIHDPEPWCAALVNDCAQTVAGRLGVRSPLEDVPLQGYVQSYVDHARKHGWVIPFSQVEPGDLFTLYYPSLKRNGHIGFVAAPSRDTGRFLTVAGNTNNDGSREGKRMWAKWRLNDDNTLFLRYA